MPAPTIAISFALAASTSTGASALPWTMLTPSNHAPSVSIPLAAVISMPAEILSVNVFRGSGVRVSLTIPLGSSPLMPLVQQLGVTPTHENALGIPGGNAPSRACILRDNPDESLGVAA